MSGNAMERGALGEECDLELTGLAFFGHRLHGQLILQHLLRVWYCADFTGVL